MNAISPTRLQCYKDCPLKFKNKYVDKKIGKRKSEKAERGSIVHRWIDEYILNHSIPSFSPPEFSEEAKKKVVQFLDSCIDSGSKSSSVYFSSEFKISVNENFSFVPFDPSENTKYRGIIDFIYVDLKKKKGVVVDWKTGKATPEAFQLEFYAFLLFNLKPLYGIDFQYYFYYLDRKRGEEFKRIEVRSMKEIGDEIRGLEGEIDGKFFSAKPSFKCLYCDFNMDCPFKAEKKKSGIFKKELGLSVLSLDWLRSK